MTRRKIVILGSTGSIGVSALDVVRRYRNLFQVVGLAANSNVDVLARQIREFKPAAVALGDAASADKLAKALAGLRQKPKIWSGVDGLERLAGHPQANFVLCGMVGSRGLLPLVAALKAGKTVGLANKESLVVAGELITSLAKKHKATVIPVDSEHSAIHQCLQGHRVDEVSRIILTASGGPFYRFDGDLDSISVAQALKHPTWKMGAKITIDSATLMNKGLEAIEAHYLFGVPMEKIAIVIHPQSIVHSLVEYADGASLAQLSHPDMRLPIQYALTYPGRMPTTVKALRLEDVGRLEFAAPDFSRFPCLRLAIEAGKRGGTAPAALSAANEVAVKAFIDGQLTFMGIPALVQRVLSKHKVRNKPSLDDVLEVDRWARDIAQGELDSRQARSGRMTEGLIHA
jgi:1-deoxy-D-xylulose-5-phosphate reductoisomerase